MIYALLAVALAEPLEVGPVVGPSGPVPLPSGLTLATCIPPVSASPPPTSDVGGRITLVVRIRRNRVSLVSTALADAALAPLGPCFERELAAASWPIRRGRLEVPITVSPPDPD